MPTYRQMWPVYAQQWDRAKRTKLTEANRAAQTALANKPRYVEVADRFNKLHGTDLPWYWIPPVHYREASFDFDTQLAQGDPLGQRSTNVPRGQGPYFGEDAWERAAIIALETDELDKVKDWRLEKLIYYWEKYNGWGYNSRGVPSAYVWAGTDVYQGGMFVADGKWDRSEIDPRVGTVAILKSMMEMDDTIRPVRETADVQPEPEPEPVPQPIPEPATLAEAIQALSIAIRAMHEVTTRLERIAEMKLPAPSTALTVQPQPRPQVNPVPQAPNLEHALPIAADLISQILGATPQGAALKGAATALQVLGELAKARQRG